jgi:hypothetical protein
MAGAGAEAGGELGETVRELREAYGGGRTRSLAWRQAQLRGLLRLLKEKEAEAFQALHKDLGKHHAEAYRDEVCVAPPSSPQLFFFFVRACGRRASSWPDRHLDDLVRFLAGRCAHQVRQRRAAAARQMDGSGQGKRLTDRSSRRSPAGRPLL